MASVVNKRITKYSNSLNVYIPKPNVNAIENILNMHGLRSGMVYHILHRMCHQTCLHKTF